jgi:hypothetical protein
MVLTAIGLLSSASAQTFGELNSSDQLGSEDFDGTVTESNSSLQGPNAQESGDNFRNGSADVEVRVTSQVAVDITPETLDYPFVDLGEQELISNESHRSVTVRNTGSEPIDRVWVNASTPSNDPFGDGAGTFEAGNFFQINISESTVNRFSSQTPDPASSYHYVNRAEYMFQDEDEVPSFIVAPNGTGEVTIGGSGGGTGTAPSELEIGALRVGGQEYYFTVLEDPSGGCTGAGSAEIRIANTPFTSSQEGTIDFTDDGPDQQPIDYTVHTISEVEAGNGIGVVNPTNSDSRVDLGSREYSLLTSCDTTVADDRENILRTRYNPTASDFDDLAENGGGAQFIFSSSTKANSIQPSQFITLDTGVEVPRGVDQGSMETGTFRLYVTSDNQT